MKVIDFLLRLYPEEFRARFARDMRAFHEQRLRENGGSWLRIGADHLRSAAAEHVRSVGPNVRLALRSMRKRPGFAAVIVLTIALGVGANAAIFSVVNGILIRPLPYPDADRVVSLSHEPPQWLVSEPQYATYRQALRSFASLAAYTRNEANLTVAGDAERIATAGVTRNFFVTLGVQPAIGRTFTSDEDGRRPATAVILSHHLWQRRYHGDPAIVGQKLILNGFPRTVVGVMPEGFEYPTRETQLWYPACSQRTCVPIGERADSLDGWANHYLWVTGRLRDGVSLEEARRETVGLARRIMREHPDNFDPETPLLPKVARVRDDLVGPTRPYLLTLLGAVGVVLLIVCANVSSLLLARGEARRREMAVRTALGASRRRLVSQLLTESAVFAAVGGALGLAIAWVGSKALVGMAPASLPRLDQIRLDWSVVLFGVAVSQGAGVLFGLMPALRTGDAPAESLKGSGKGMAHIAARRARRALVVAEFALAMVLLSGAGMLMRSLVRLQNADIGFVPSGALTAKVSPSAGYTDTTTVLFYRQLLERVRAIPGVRAAGAARWLPVVDAGGLWDIRIEGKTYRPSQTLAAVPQEVTPGYFAAMGIPMLAGRDFDDRDRVGAPLVAIVSRVFAETHWRGEDPLGRRFRLGGLDTAWVTVVGVVNDIKSRGATDRPEPTMYLPHAQTSASSYFVPRSMSLVVRTSGEPLTLAAPVRAAVRAIAPQVPVSSVMTLEAVVGTSTANRRFSTGLIVGFALLALLLAGIGIYGVSSYAISERRFEIGVRMALGADRSRILGMVLGEGARMAGMGIVIGIGGAALLAYVIRRMLFGVSTIDVPSLAAVALLLGFVALLASLLAARRAAAVEPTEALRQT